MKIHARNLRGVTLHTLDVPDENCILVADNGSGKSTMSLVPYWVLTGKGLRIKDGEALCEGAVDFGNGITISRQIDYSKSKTTIIFNGNKVTEKTMKEELARRNLNVAVMEKFFMPITQIDNDSMLAAAGMSLSVDSVLKNFTVGQELIKNYFDSIGITTVSIPSITKCEKFFSEQRKVLKRDIKASENVIADIGNVPDDASLKAQIEVTLAHLTETTQKSTKAHSELNIIDASSDMRKSIESQKKKIAELEANNVTNDFTEETSNIKAKKLEYDSLLAEKSKSRSIIDGNIAQEEKGLTDLNENLIKLREQINAKGDSIKIIEGSTSCPLYAGIACSTDKTIVISVLKNEISELKNSETDISTSIKNSTTTLNSFHQQLSMIETEIEKIKNDSLALDNRLRVIENEIKLSALRRDRISELKTQLSETEKAYAKMNIPTNEDVLTEKAAIADAEILEEKQRLSSLQSALQASARKSQLESELQKQIEKKNLLDEIIAEIKEFPGTIFTRIIKPLETTANNVLSTLKPDWTLTIGKDGAVTVNTPTAAIPMDDLSTGEKIILNYCLKNVIAQLIGFGNIIIDDCDVLDKKSMSTLLSVISNSNIHTLLIVAKEIAQPNLKKITL